MSLKSDLLRKLSTTKSIGVGLGGIAIPSRLRALRPDKVDEIAESFQQLGQLQPIVVRKNDADNGYILVAGRHRLAAAKQLKWDSIAAVILDADPLDIKLAEIDENLIRAELSDGERALFTAERKIIYEKKNPTTGTGKTPGAGRGKGKQARKGAKMASFQEDTAKKTGRSRRAVERDSTRGKETWLPQIIGTCLDSGSEIDALRKLPEKERNKLIKLAKNGEKVSAKTKAKQHARAEREKVLAEKQVELPDQKFGVIVSDPEWHDETWSEAGKNARHPSNHYPTSDAAVIAARPVKKLAADDCVLLMWTTNQHLSIALGIMEKDWGFTYKSNYVWDKVIAGTGRWNRSRHEILLIGTIGEPPCPAPGEQWESIIVEKRTGPHSSKPEKVMQMIEEYYPNMPKIELNCRGKPRDGWSGWGLEAEQKEAAE
jgi:N6-adenosine-specific RNA methylase IME4